MILFHTLFPRWTGGGRPPVQAAADAAAPPPDGAKSGSISATPPRARERLGLIIVLFAVVVLAGTLTSVVFALNQMASEANRIEGRLTARSAEAAVKAFMRRLGESQGDYARWDDAVRFFYGTPDPDFVAQNLIASTAESTFFDTAYLLDEDGREVLGYRNGQAVAAKADAAFGPALKPMLARLPHDGRTYAVETGLLQTVWGLAAVAVGPIVPNTPAIADPPQRARMLVIAKALDQAAVERLGEDFVIDGFKLGGAASASGLTLTDPTGRAVGQLTWSPPQLGHEAHAQVSPAVFAMLALLALGMVVLTILAVRSLGRSNRLAETAEAQQRQLNAALANMPHGLCMFDANNRLVLCNSRYAELYKLPPHLVRPGTPLEDIVGYRHRIGNAPLDFPNYVTHEGLGFEFGSNSVFEIALEDGRTVRLNHLALRGGGYVATHEDVSENTRAKKRMTYMAKHDALTNLPNRTLFREKLHEAFGAVSTAGRFAVHCIDLDRFKGVNETLGHPVGDALLSELARRLRACVGPADTVARLSGDEFAIIQIDAGDPASVVALAESIIQATKAPYVLGEDQVVISVSIGVALAPEDGSDPDELLKHADLALFRAKKDGRGTYCFFEPTMNAKVQKRRVLEMGMRRALAHREFELHYQPLVSLKDSKPTGFEALLRWRDPERGLIQPAEFIPLAEETGLIIPIGEWVLRQACADAASWPHDLRVAVNLSAVQFRSRDLATMVFNAFAAAELPADRLEIEITESVLLENSESTLATLHRLRDFGVHISMDDFGTGYSALSYLRSFPFDKIKIDQSFVSDVSGNDDSLAIVRAVTGLGAALGMTITAEGVETREQLDCLRREGCTEGQGFLFSPPLSSAQLAAFFADPKWFALSAQEAESHHNVAKSA